MKQATLLEKLEILGNLLFSSPFLLTMLSATLLLIVVLIVSTKKKTKFSKLSCVIIYLTMIAITLIKYNKSLFSIIDYIIENIFVVIYFPNLIMYIGMLIIVDIIMILTITKKQISSFTRKINIFGFSFIHLLFFLILDSIVSNNIDVSSKMAIYTNTELLALLELSTGLFVIWMLILGINFIANKISSRSLIDEKPLEELDEEIERQIKEEDVEVLLVEDINIQEEPTYEEKVKQDYSELDGLTLNDYKQIKSILNAIK